MHHQGSLTARRLQAFCRQQFPDRQGLETDNLKQINTGWECDVYTFDLHWRQQERQLRQELVLRLYFTGSGEPLIPDKHRREFGVLRELHACGYPVPAVLAVDDGAHLQRPAVIMQRIDGTPLSAAYTRATANERQALLHSFSRLLRQLHQLDWRSFAEQLAVDVNGDPIGQAIDTLSDGLNKLGSREFEPAIGWLGERAALVTRAPRSLAHWDYHADNVLIRNCDGQLFVIDWTAADVTDCRFDLAWSRLLMGGQLGRALLIEYERQYGHPLVDLDFFLAYACVRRLFLMSAAIRAGAESLGMRAGAEAVIRNNHRHLQDVYRCLQSLTGVTLPEIETLIMELHDGIMPGGGSR